MICILAAWRLGNEMENGSDIKSHEKFRNIILSEKGGFSFFFSSSIGEDKCIECLAATCTSRTSSVGRKLDVSFFLIGRKLHDFPYLSRKLDTALKAINSKIWSVKRQFREVYVLDLESVFHKRFMESMPDKRNLEVVSEPRGIDPKPRVYSPEEANIIETSLNSLIVNVINRITENRAHNESVNFIESEAWIEAGVNELWELYNEGQQEEALNCIESGSFPLKNESDSEEDTCCYLLTGEEYFKPAMFLMEPDEVWDFDEKANPCRRDSSTSASSDWSYNPDETKDNRVNRFVSLPGFYFHISLTSSFYRV